MQSHLAPAHAAASRPFPQTHGHASARAALAVMLCLHASAPARPYAARAFTLCSRGPVAQLGERHTGSVEVRGSSPLGSTNTTTASGRDATSAARVAAGTLRSPVSKRLDRPQRYLRVGSPLPPADDERLRAKLAVDLREDRGGAADAARLSTLESAQQATPFPAAMRSRRSRSTGCRTRCRPSTASARAGTMAVGLLAHRGLTVDEVGRTVPEVRPPATRRRRIR